MKDEYLSTLSELASITDENGFLDGIRKRVPEWNGLTLVLWQGWYRTLRRPDFNETLKRRIAQGEAPYSVAEGLALDMAEQIARAKYAEIKEMERSHQVVDVERKNPNLSPQIFPPHLNPFSQISRERAAKPISTPSGPIQPGVTIKDIHIQPNYEPPTKLGNPGGPRRSINGFPVIEPWQRKFTKS